MSIRDPAPDTVFQIQVLEIVLQDEERKQEIEEMKSYEKHGKNKLVLPKGRFEINGTVNKH